MKDYNSFARDRTSDRKRFLYPARKKTYRRRSSSSSSSSDSSDSPRKTEDMCLELRVALERGDHKQVNSIVKELSRTAK